VARDGARASSFDEKMRQHQAVEFGVEMTGRRNTSKMIRGVDCVLALVVFKEVVRGVGAAGSSSGRGSGGKVERLGGDDTQNFTKSFSVVMRNTS
jgi:hypothetical protein